MEAPGIGSGIFVSPVRVMIGLDKTRVSESKPINSKTTSPSTCTLSTRQSVSG